MLAIQPQLYQRICTYELDDPSHQMGFLAHLMRANGWSRPFASRAIEEYRKFVFLALVADHQVTPSDQVDQVWHLHLIFSEAYWNDFCPRVLGRPLHHQPTRGAQEERDRFLHLYRATIHTYRRHFGEPPADLWPPVDVRFGRDLRMQRRPIRDPFLAWRRWRWTTRASVLVVSLGLMGCGIAKAAAGPNSDPPLEGGDVLLAVALYLIVSASSLMVGLAASSWFVRPWLLQPTGFSSTPQLEEEDVAFLSAGPGRMLELGLASLVQRGILRADPSTRTLVLIGRTDEAPPGIAQQMLTVYRKLAPDGPSAVSYGDIAALNRYDFKAKQESLQSRGLLLHGLAKPIAQWSGHPLTLIAMFMLITRFFLPNLPPLLALLLPPCFLGFGLGLKQPSGRTLWGDSVLERYTRSSAHADPLRRVALLGSAAMGGEGLDDLRSLIKNVEADLAATAVGCGC
jgi:uncharacterized protein (TIGR04222 family)